MDLLYGCMVKPHVAILHIANTKARTLSVKKANYGNTGGQINLQWEAGRFVAEAEPTGMEKFAQSAKAERVFLKLLDLMREQGRKVNASGGQT